MKTQNPVSQKIRISDKINKKGYFRQKCQASEKYVHFNALNTGWASFCMNYCINAAWHGDNQPVAPLRCNESTGCFDSAFRSYALLGLVSSTSSWHHRFSIGFRSDEFAGQSSTVTPWSLNQLLVPLACGQVPSPVGKWNQHLHKACQQNSYIYVEHEVL